MLYIEFLLRLEFYSAANSSTHAWCEWVSGAQNDIYGGQSEIVLRRVAASMIFSLDAVERCSSSVTQNFLSFSLISIFVGRENTGESNPKSYIEKR